MWMPTIITSINITLDVLTSEMMQEKEINKDKDQKKKKKENSQHFQTTGSEHTKKVKLTNY